MLSVRSTMTDPTNDQKTIRSKETERAAYIQSNLIHSNIQYITYHSCVLIILYLIILELTLNPPEGIIAGPVNEENFFEWEAYIM